MSIDILAGRKNSCLRRNFAAEQTRARRNSVRDRPLWRMIGHGSAAGRARGILRAWVGWERFSSSLWPTQFIPRAPYSLLRFRLVRYRGDQISLPPHETVISPGDLVAELHCDNAALVAMIHRGGMNRCRACRRDLESLSRWIAETQDTSPIKALYGVTMLWGAAARLGFAVREQRRSIRNRLDRVFMAGLLLIYSTDGPNRASRGKTLDGYPREVWLSRAELLRRYADASPAAEICERSTTLNSSAD